MKERPILFSAPMVRAILAGTKTQTRRVLRDQDPVDLGAFTNGSHFSRRPLFDKVAQAVVGHRLVPVCCPYGQPGDRLWVREAWARDDEAGQVMYRADIGRDSCADAWEQGRIEGVPRYKWRPSIHMPRTVCRLELMLESVRVERLNDISEADAQAEGCALECMTPTGDDSGSAIHGPGGYIALWESINGPGSWDANPWVWCVEFKQVAA